jgi:hypothetical protein
MITKLSFKRFALDLLKKVYNKIPASIGNFIVKLFSSLSHPFVYINYFLHNNDEFDCELAVVAIVKNEAPYIVEWIEYHKIIGVEKFYIYDNDSTDGLPEILRKYIESGEVVYHIWHELQIHQMKVYNTAIKKHRNESRWMAFIDIDEFIVPVKKETLPDVMINITNNLRQKLPAGIAISWLQFGYSGHYSKPSGFVIENYTRRDSEIHVLVKSIVNPRTVLLFTNPHVATHLFGLWTINEKGIKLKKPIIQEKSDRSVNEIRINHYFTKSYEEYLQKCERNRAGFNRAINTYNLPEFDSEFYSIEKDVIISRFIPALKSRINN